LDRISGEFLFSYPAAVSDRALSPAILGSLNVTVSVYVLFSWAFVSSESVISVFGLGLSESLAASVGLSGSRLCYQVSRFNRSCLVQGFSDLEPSWDAGNSPMKYPLTIYCVSPLGDSHNSVSPSVDPSLVVRISAQLGSSGGFRCTFWLGIRTADCP
jgi:hypothetical protein